MGQASIYLTIGYKDGSLYDIDTEHGYGPDQRKWLDGQMAYTDEVLSELGNSTYGKSGTLLS